MIITIVGPVINPTNEGMKEVRHSLTGLERHRFQPQRTLDECYDLDDMRSKEQRQKPDDFCKYQ